MKKRISWVLSFLTVFVLIFSNIGSMNTVKAYENYDQPLVGQNNLNNTPNNSAQIGDELLAPERGWTRYDDTNSKIEYIGTRWDHIVNQTKGLFYKDTYSSCLSVADNCKMSFTFVGSKFRLIQRISHDSDISKYAAPISVYGDGSKLGDVSPVNQYKPYTWQGVSFEYKFPTYGTHTVQIVDNKVPDGIWSAPSFIDAIEIDSEGELLYNNTTNGAILNIESPKNGNTYTGSFNLSGYALNKSGIKYVKTYIDGAYSRDTQIGISRADIGALYPTYPGSNNSGFSTTYNASDFTLGTHTMKVQAIGNDGTIQEKLLYLYVFDSNIIVESETYIHKLYRDILGREPDQVGLTYWNNEVMKVGAAQVVSDFLFGPEALSKNYSNEQWVSILYKVMYGREADQGGLSYWANKINEGYPKKAVIAIFSRNQEFIDLCAKYKVPSQPLVLTATTDIYPDATVYVTKVYRGLLNRDPDAEGLNYWLTRLAVNKEKCENLIRTSTSSELQNLTNDEYLNRLYKGILFRDPDYTGFSNWKNYLASGGSRETVLNTMLQSGEYKNVCAAYGLNY